MKNSAVTLSTESPRFAILHNSTALKKKIQTNFYPAQLRLGHPWLRMRFKLLLAA